MRKAVEIKIEMLKRGLTIAHIARELDTSSTASENGLYMMIAGMINGQRWYPTLAEEVNEQFDLGLERPENFKPITQRKAA